MAKINEFHQMCNKRLHNVQTPARIKVLGIDLLLESISMEKQDRAHPIPLRQWPDGWPKNERALRYLSTKPEFERAFFRVGGTVLVDREKFWEIVRSQGQAA